ncbi:MAG: hypothetical protein HC827_10630 [Cyanobacteria bacterium RM1_2_2]|nr:hypothetical protein [Cyanobacteria bacterium RM1_2_2]
MITDPENQDEQPYRYDEPILASSPEEATRICRIKAQQDGVKLIQVKQPTRIRSGKNQQYRCIFEANSIE